MKIAVCQKWITLLQNRINSFHNYWRFIVILCFQLFCSVSFAQPIIAQFIGIFHQPGHWHDRIRKSAPLNKLNRVYLAFGSIVLLNGQHTLSWDGKESYVQDIVNRLRSENPTAQVFLTVGGNGEFTSYGGAATDPAFATNVANFLITNGLSGIDLDWELSLNRSQLSLLVQNLANTLHPLGLKVTLDVWPFVNSAYDIPVLSQNLDQMNLMSYGIHTSLNLVASQFITAGFPANKLIGGIETESTYKEGVDTLGPQGTIAQKATYALQNGLAGMMAWRLDNDYATPGRPNRPTYAGAEQL